MKVTVLYVGSSLLAPLKDAEREINHAYKLDLRIAAYNFGAPLDDDRWSEVANDLAQSEAVFAIHVMDGENASRLMAALDRYKQHRAVIVINCMPELMRRTRMGKLDLAKLSGAFAKSSNQASEATRKSKSARALRLFGTASSWVGRQTRGQSSGGTNGATNGGNGHKNGHGQYLKLVDRLPGLLKFVPGVGAMRDIKNYLNIFCYFLQPTPANIRSMVLTALNEYVPDARLANAVITIPPPEHLPSVAIYHPDAPGLFETFETYQNWYLQNRPKSKVQSPKSEEQSAETVKRPLDAEATIGLLLMRPQVVSKTTKHYDALIRAIEAEGLSVIPALSTLMDNREAVSKFFVDKSQSKVQSPKSKVKKKDQTTDNRQLTTDHSRVSQIVSLTGFSFVGGPAMNDSEAAAAFLSDLNRPYRSAVSLDVQTIDSWRASQTGLNPIQSGMQIAIPEIDGATEPFIYGGLPERGVEPVALEDRCRRYARRLKRWHRLQTAPRKDLTLALVLFCFPPNKGNIGTAADLDVFPSIWQTLLKLKDDGYEVELPESADKLRERLIDGNADQYSATANVAHRMTVEEYRLNCPYVDDIESDWGSAPGRINSFGGELLIQGIQLGKVFVGVQPTFGFEGDPMRLMMARSGAPHHGFMAFYTYLSRILKADAVVHVGTHGSLEFMPGKQVGLSGECWPDRLIDELPNVYLYSVNNPSEGSIAKRRSYAELISYLTPPMENAGVYRDLATLKDLVMSYRQTDNDNEREKLFESIEEYSRLSNLHVGTAVLNHPS
ncbi:MAG: cobaltochelatase subunit CobN [bacterium]